LVQVIREIDKVDKIGWPALEDNLLKVGLSQDAVTKLKTDLSVTQYIEQDPYLTPILEDTKKLGINSIVPKLYLARGLDYYTGLIIEVVIPKYSSTSSVGGGGRYDNLIGMFTGQNVPAVGFAFGFDRIIEAMEELNLFPADIAEATSKVLVTIFSEETKKNSLEVATKLRAKGINAELYLGELKEKNPLEKQLKYANQKNIPYVIVIGPEEVAKNIVMLKDMKTRDQQPVSIDEAISQVTK
jgi:histidyl-tRNA synthetase